jgi:hypothetical protein
MQCPETQHQAHTRQLALPLFAQLVLCYLSAPYECLLGLLYAHPLQLLRLH